MAQSRGEDFEGFAILADFDRGSVEFSTTGTNLPSFGDEKPAAFFGDQALGKFPGLRGLGDHIGEVFVKIGFPVVVCVDEFADSVAVEHVD